ncbi:MAG TPA: radical SAM protein [Vicinamibacterales bacterium]
MKICLVSAATANQLTNALAEPEAARIMGDLAPVGILSLAAVLEANGLQPEVVDLNRVYYRWLCDGHGCDFAEFAGDFFAGSDYDLFGFSTVCSSYPLTLRVAEQVKRAHPRSVIVLGGPQASVTDTATIRTFPWIDVIVRGEAEQTLPALVAALSRGDTLSGIAGVTFRGDEEEIVRNADAPMILDLDALPFPAFHLFPDVRFCRHFPLELGRGCPFSCTFCSTNDFFRRRFRLKSPARMIDEMRWVRENYGISSFELVHDMFTVDRKRVEAFCEALLESGDAFIWGCSARTDCIDEELIALMAKAGCRGIFLGIETGSARMQKVIDKGLDLSDSAERVHSCDRFNINTAVSMMAGFPEETMDDLRATAAFFVDSLRYDHADPQLSILSPLADTPITKLHRESLVLDDDVADMSYRGWTQSEGDHDLIAGHPEIFSSFYSIPLPHLHRDFLRELRDFLLNGMRGFRRLLLGLHQDSGDIVAVFERWLQWRTSSRTTYYAQPAFRADFLRFVTSDYIPNASKAPIALTALAEYEAALLHQSNDAPLADNTEVLLAPDSRPQLMPGVDVIVISADYQEVVRRLRERSPLHDVPARPVKLAVRGPEVRQLTPLSADLLRLCAENLTVAEIADELRQSKADIAGLPADKLCLAGLEILRQQGLVGVAGS